MKIKLLNDPFKEKLEKIQYSATCTIMGATKGTSRERLHKEFGLKCLCDGRWYRKRAFFHKILKGLTPPYLQSYLLLDNDRIFNSR